MKKKHLKPAALILIVLSAVLFFIYVPDHYLSLEYVKSIHSKLVSFYESDTFMTVSIYMAVYIIMAALSLPGAALMSLAGASIFGFGAGLVIISFASSIGATIAFLASRFIFRDFIQTKYSEKLRKINQGVEKDGIFYLFTLRLIPVFPFFIINLVMGLTPIKTSVFYIVSQIGMLPGTAVYVNAGTRLGELSSTEGILSPALVFSFVLLGIFPWAGKFFINFIKQKKALSGFKKPKKFDYNLIVIGGGSAGLVSSYIAATVNSKVCLIEKNKMGGDCLNTGCVPSKAIIKTSKILSYTKNPAKYGIDSINAEFEFKKIMERVKHIIKKIEPHDSVERYTGLGVECISGEARIISPFEVMVNEKNISAKNIIIATGARPFVPPIKGLEKIKFLTSENLWEIESLPKNFVIIGGGPIGCEIAQAFSRIGSNVTIIEMSDRILGTEDDDIVEFIGNKFKDENISILTGHTIKEIKTENNKKILVSSFKESDFETEFDEILIAAGRMANTENLWSKNLEIELNKNKTIKVDEYLRTNIPTIYCAGDVAGPYQFTHAAAHQAWYSSVNSLFGRIKKFRADYSVIPFAIYTDPEFARTGLSEKEALEKNIEYEITKYDLKDLDRAIADSCDCGFVKILTKKGSDKILGVSIAGENASNIISEFVLAMKYNLGLNKILGTIHIYPTFAEANKYAAGEWKKARKPEKILNFMKKFHTWMRG
ncbi:MAG: FAD-dependent oxidoreductase [Desulfobacteraceae bacterium]